MRAAVEQQLDLIALGKAEFDDVLLHFTHLFQKKFDYFEKSITLMDQLFEVSPAQSALAEVMVHGWAFR